MQVLKLYHEDEEIVAQNALKFFQVRPSLTLPPKLTQRVDLRREGGQRETETETETGRQTGGA